MVEGYLELARSIDNVLSKEDHSVESLKSALLSLRSDCKDKYQEGADDLGWNVDADDVFE